jgi:hypothetical protein
MPDKIPAIPMTATNINSHFIKDMGMLSRIPLFSSTVAEIINISGMSRGTKPEKKRIKAGTGPFSYLKIPLKADVSNAAVNPKPISRYRVVLCEDIQSNPPFDAMIMKRKIITAKKSR